MEAISTTNLSFEDVLDSITIETIVAVFRNSKEKKKIRDIKNEVLLKLYSSSEYDVSEDEKSQIFSKIESLIKADKKLGVQSYLSNSSGYYRKRAIKANIEASTPSIGADYVGRAGECAVMSELMFRGYNANRMMIDEGVDIIAVKDNLYFYVQVKTTYIKDGRIYTHINSDKFGQFMSAQIRYIIVARYEEGGMEKNMFFQLNPALIHQGIYQKFIKEGDKGISIKIKFHDRSGEPILYDEKEMMIDFYKNNFNL